MTNSQARLIAVALFLIAMSNIATFRDAGAQLIGGLMIVVGVILFSVEYILSYSGKPPE